MNKLTEDIINGHWHLRKDVTYGNIVSTIMICVAFVVGWINIEKDLVLFHQHMDRPAHELAELRLDSLRTDMVRVQTNGNAMLSRFVDGQDEIIRRLERIEDRLNRYDGSPK